ncbi:MAG: hypothetical protein K2M31_05820 [Muribaculaceae bacterium]|nr:hypothetical protein [Muribaculaceae bacterium]
MRKFFSNYGFGASKVFMTLAMLIATVMLTKAQDVPNPVAITETNQVLSEGVTYSYPAYVPISASFTPSVDGVLRIEGFQNFGIYETCVTPGKEYSDQRTDHVALDPGARIREIKVTKGKTIYFFDSFTMGADTVTLYLENAAPLAIQYMQPDLNEVVDFNNYPSTQLTFNQNAKSTESSANISFTNRLTNQTTTIPSRISGNGTKMLTIPFYTQLKPYITSGAIRPTDPFTVTIMGLQSEKGVPFVNADADGNATFTFLCGSIPTLCTDYYCPDPFLSYWPEGTPEGILTMTFDRPLGTSDKTYAEIAWGNQEGEDGQYYTEILPVKIDGQKVTVDFTGKLRTPATMTPLYPDGMYDIMAVNVSYIVDEFGVPVGSEGAGTIGSYGFSPRYQLLQKGALAAEFEPASGADLNTISNVNVWISGIKAISFDGFKLEVTDKNSGEVSVVVVPMSDVKVTPDGTDAAEYDFALPADVKANAKTVVVTLNNVVSNDGYNHDNDVRATYGGFVITYIDPAPGSEMKTLDQGSIITIEANVAEQYPNMYVEYEIYEVDPETQEKEIIKSVSWMTRQADGSYQSEVFGDYKLIYGKEYHAVFTAWEEESIRYYTPEESLGSDFIIWKGLTPPYIYSNITLTDINPAANELLENDVITLTFDGIVNLGVTTGYSAETGIIEGMGAGLQPFKEVRPINPEVVDGTTYASSWELVLPDGYLNSRTTPVNISFKAYDEQGRLVKGTDGVDETSCFIYQFDIPGMYKEISIDFGTEPITSVKEIKVSYPIGINVSYDMLFSEIKVMNRMQQEVAVMEDFILDENPDNPYATATSGRIILDKAITEEGGYMLYIPRGFFNLGTEFDTAKNAEVMKPFSVAMAPFTVTPAEGTVESLETIVIAYNGGLIKLAEGTTLKPYYNFAGETANYSFASVSAFDNELTLKFKAKTNEAGTYTVIVPEGLVLFTDDAAAPAVTLTYVIDEVVARPNITVEPAEGNVTSIPQYLRILFDDYDEVGAGMGIATLSVNDQTPSNLGDLEYDWEDDRLNLILQGTGANPEYTADGTYVFSFPAGYFSLGSEGAPSPAFTLTYTIGQINPGYSATFDPEPGVVKELSQVDVIFPDYEEATTGSGTASISVNGAMFENLPDAMPSFDVWNKVEQPLGKTYTENGVIEIFFPAGYFIMVNGFDETPSQEMSIRYEIDNNVGVTAVDIDAKSYTVYSLSGVLLLENADREAFKALAPGLYIVNGVKIVKK